MVTWQRAAGLLIIASAVAGCGESTYQDYSGAPLSDGHDHGHENDGHSGRHGGHVLELDDAHRHHAEMLFDNATRDITLYFYGSEVGVAKAAAGLAFEIEIDGVESLLEARTTPLDGETPETSSRYVIAGRQLPESIKSEEQLDGHFHVTIDGQAYVGSFHAHGHDGDTHDAHDHADQSHEHTDDATGKTDGKPASEKP